MPVLKSDMKITKHFLGQFPLPPGPPRELPALRDGIQINQQGDLVNCMQGLDAAATMLPLPPSHSKIEI
jgi:hypothetical protein